MLEWHNLRELPNYLYFFLVRLKMKIYVKLWIKTYEKCALLRKSNLEKAEFFFFLHEIQFKFSEVESRYKVLYIARSVKFSTYIFFWRTLNQVFMSKLPRKIIVNFIVPSNWFNKNVKIKTCQMFNGQWIAFLAKNSSL